MLYFNQEQQKNSDDKGKPVVRRGRKAKGSRQGVGTASYQAEDGLYLPKPILHAFVRGIGFFGSTRPALI